ncbi:MAG TPA: hypothetical protein VJ901_22765 [Thermoanaerobaculia bacterium]|nr:hypothetical protein [Thermoanaerobaculia bacterium]
MRRTLERVERELTYPSYDSRLHVMQSADLEREASFASDAERTLVMQPRAAFACAECGAGDLAGGSPPSRRRHTEQMSTIKASVARRMFARVLDVTLRPPRG